METDETVDERELCRCGCGCGEAAGVRDGTTWLCTQCTDYFVAPGGECVCSRVADGDTCHVCTEHIRWSGILTGQPGTGRPNYRVGDCACGEDYWHQRDEGGWRLAYGAPPEDEPEDD